MIVIDRIISVPHLNQSRLYIRWKKLISGQPIDGEKLFSETYSAWQRCAACGVNPFKLQIKCLSEEELQYRKSRMREILNLLQSHIETIKRTLSTHSNVYFIAVADQEGYIMEVYSDRASENTVCNLPLYPGVCFDEKYIGNNGIGSVLAIGKPLAVIGAEHYSKLFHKWTSVGAPILGDDGKILAVIKVNIPCGLESPYTFSLTVAAAKAVEAALKQTQMERQLQEFKKILRQLMQQRDIIFNAISQGVVILNKEGTVTFFNKAAERIWNLQASEIGGENFNCLDESRCRRLELLLLRTIREAKPFTNIECKCKNDQHDKFLLVNTSLLRDENDAVAGAIGIYTDVTELRRQEARIREQEKLAVVGQMAAGMAHEIRNPLASVRGFAQLMSEKIGQINSTFKEYMEIMIQEIDQADSFINNFLQLARPKPPAMQQCSLNELITSFARIFESQAFLRGVKLKTDLQEDLPPIIIDRDQIKQVLLNLCQNALQAMDLRGTIILATSHHKEEKEICLSVIDDGPGISPENLDKLGTPFFTTKDKGTGLGLSISYTIVDRHRGRIEVDSKLGEGTRFSIYLPVDQQF
ncbi:multi-sensor signal transduction histidine kinase [Desulforamulus profundi]|uniref:histidine kinase n=1 Tax=Desulforamulus profundi TaxID=1383067 RepID=A0A2C6M5E1_9FIRM|nr:ATP-binding protein [Desulforamulus profundi]PHJ37427.1 multi-sensor signal transduction histidine kinase [Desulforamulus profundi]